MKDSAQGHEVPAWGVSKETRYYFEPILRFKGFIKTSF